MSAIAWIVPEVSNMENQLVEKAITAFRTKALGATQSDPFDEAMQQVTDRIRAEIANNQTISLTENAIPPSLLWVAKLLIVEALATRLPGLESLIASQADQRSDARDYLKRINRGDIQVEAPDDPMIDEVLQGGSGIVIVSSQTLRAGRCQTAGL